MPQPSKAIFDTSVLSDMLQVQSVDLFKEIRLIMQEVIVPRTVVQELEAWKNPKFIARTGYFKNQINQNKFYKLCDTYDPIIFDEVRKHIDEGEADAVAQSSIINVKLFITNDIKCQKYIRDEYPHIRIHSIFLLIALSYFQSFFTDVETLMQELHQINNVSQKDALKKRVYRAMIRQDVIEVLKMLGYPIEKNKRRISFLTSLKNYI